MLSLSILVLSLKGNSNNEQRIFNEEKCKIASCDLTAVIFIHHMRIWDLAVCQMSLRIVAVNPEMWGKAGYWRHTGQLGSELQTKKYLKDNSIFGYNNAFLT